EHAAMTAGRRRAGRVRTIAAMLRLFLPATANEARLRDRVDRDIGRVVELGFLRPLKGRDDTYEVRRILRSFVDAQWLGQLNERLADYVGHASEGLDGGAGGAPGCGWSGGSEP